MNRELFLFVRPPRPLWPFNSPSSAFWPPLAFASMAAQLRQDIPDLSVEILDAPALEMGWKSLELELVHRRPAYVGIGEEAVSCLEGLRLARLVHRLGAKVVAGGCFFGHVAAQALRTGLIDVVVHGEGELTLVEVVQALRSGQHDLLRTVQGISFTEWPHTPGNPEEAGVTTTPARPLLKDLDQLPMPAYDLLPVDRYGANSRNHPRLASVELGRGCVGSCDFCILWRQMGRSVHDGVVPHLRVKSAERLLEEIEILTTDFGRSYLGWVDPCFNAHPEVPARLSELMLKKNLRLGQSAWMRSDAIVRDSRSGALRSCVASGLNEAYIGVERPDEQSMVALGKSTTVRHSRAALSILRSDYPEVLVIGSFIYGLSGDTPQSVRAAHRLAMELELDQFFFIPLTPLPGTAGWRDELWDPGGDRFREFSFLPSGKPNGRHSHLERALLWSVLTNWPWPRLRTYARQVFCRDARRRRIRRRLNLRGALFHLNRLVSWFSNDADSGLVFPAWYDS